MPKRIFISAGHEGSVAGMDGGARGNGLVEADVNLSVALLLEKQLQRLGFVTMQARTTNTRISAAMRLRMAENFNADMLIDVHCNAFDINTANGYETFFAATKPQDRAMAAAVHNAYIGATGLRDRGVKLDTASQHSGGLAILRSPIPSVLVELGFITASPTFLDFTFLQHRHNCMAKALAQGIADFYGVTAEDENKGDDEMRFNSIEEMPDWARPTIEKLVHKGFLRGDGNGNLDLSLDMIRIFVVHDMAGVYDG